MFGGAPFAKTPFAALSSGPQQTLTQTARFDNTNTFYAATLKSTNTLAPALYTNTNAFYAATVSASVTLSPALYTNTNTFYAAALKSTNTLSPALYSNLNTFYAATLKNTNTLTPALYANANAFYSAYIALVTTIRPGLFTNSSTFFTAALRNTNTLLPPPYVNQNDFYPASAYASITLGPTLYTNPNVFYGGRVDTYIDLLQTARFDSLSQFYAAVIKGGSPVPLPYHPHCQRDDRAVAELARDALLVTPALGGTMVVPTASPDPMSVVELPRQSFALKQRSRNNATPGC